VSADVLKLHEENGVLTLLMDRPEKRNALSGELVDALARAVQGAGAREEIRVVLLRGAGSDFCAGADLEELQGMLDQSEEAGMEDARRLGSLLLALREIPKPTVAAIQGRALAGGCGLATACDLILAREDSELGYPEVHLGFVPAMVMAILRRKIPEGLAFELVATGRRISAEEAHRMGLVNRVIPVDGFEGRVRAFAEELARRPPSALALTKALLYEQDGLSVAQGIERGAQVNVEARRTEACREGVASFLARRGGGAG